MKQVKLFEKLFPIISLAAAFFETDYSLTDISAG